MHACTHTQTSHHNIQINTGRKAGPWVYSDTRGALRQPWHRTMTTVVMLRPGALRMVLIDGGWGDGGKGLKGRSLQ